MLKLSDINTLLKSQFASALIYNGTINRDKSQCIGLYTRDNGSNISAVGDKSLSSYSILGVSILVHWTENADSCEVFADDIFEFLRNKKDFTVNGKKVLFVNMEGNGPIDISRDEKNICEMVVHANFYYER